MASTANLRIGKPIRFPTSFRVVERLELIAPCLLRVFRHRLVVQVDELLRTLCRVGPEFIECGVQFGLARVVNFQRFGQRVFVLDGLKPSLLRRLRGFGRLGFRSFPFCGFRSLRCFRLGRLRSILGRFGRLCSIGGFGRLGRFVRGLGVRRLLRVKFLQQCRRAFRLCRHLWFGLCGVRLRRRSIRRSRVCRRSNGGVCRLFHCREDWRGSGFFIGHYSPFLRANRGSFSACIAATASGSSLIQL